MRFQFAVLKGAARAFLGGLMRVLHDSFCNPGLILRVKDNPPRLAYPFWNRPPRSWRCAHMLLIAAANRGLTRWTLTPDGPSFPVKTPEDLFRQPRGAPCPLPDEIFRKWPEHIRKAHDLLKKAEAAEAQRRPAQEASDLAMLQRSLRPLWPSILARYWIMSQRPLYRRLSIRFDSRHNQGCLKLTIDRVPSEVRITFRPERLVFERVEVGPVRTKPPAERAAAEHSRQPLSD